MKKILIFMAALVSLTSFSFCAFTQDATGDAAQVNKTESKPKTVKKHKKHTEKKKNTTATSNISTKNKEKVK